jgi:membrane protease YdiL (CAAX protease family)
MPLDPGTEPLEALPDTSEDSPGPPVSSRPTFVERTVALLEVLLCSDYLTQIALGATLMAAGISPTAADGGLSLQYVVALSLIDTVVLISLILVFLRVHGEDPRSIFLGNRRVASEILAGVGLTFVAFALAVVVLGLILQFAPELHTVADNPLEPLMGNARDAVIFAVVVVIAGGFREELQRGFLLYRFEHWLGGARVGVVVTSVLFGLGHIPQGVDASIATAMLGALWGVVYLRRRSVVAPVVSHSGFNLLQLVQFLIVRR